MLTNGDGRDDECVSVEERGGLGGEVPAEVLEEQVFLRLLLVAAFRGHGVCGSATGGSAAQRSGASTLTRRCPGEKRDASAQSRKYVASSSSDSVERRPPELIVASSRRTYSNSPPKRLAVVTFH